MNLSSANQRTPISVAHGSTVGSTFDGRVNALPGQFYWTGTATAQNTNNAVNVIASADLTNGRRLLVEGVRIPSVATPWSGGNAIIVESTDGATQVVTIPTATAPGVNSNPVVVMGGQCVAADNTTAVTVGSGGLGALLPLSKGIRVRQTGAFSAGSNLTVEVWGRVI